MLAHVPEFKAGNRLGRVAGQHLARRRHVERAPAPAADAGLGIAGIVVRHHRVDDDAPVVARAQVLHRRRGTLDLLAARHQCGAVLDRPAVVLHVRDLDPARAEREREIDHVADPVDVGAVHHRVHGERQLVPNDLGRECALPGKRPVVAGDAVGGRSVGVLDGDLHMVEPGLGERAEGLVRDADRGGDEIGVETGGMGAGGDIDEVAARAGLAARQMHLQDTKPRRLAEDAHPGRGVELILSRIKRERVGAIGAAERTAVGQLGEQAERLVHHCGTR